VWWRHECFPSRGIQIPELATACPVRATARVDAKRSCDETVEERPSTTSTAAPLMPGGATRFARRTRHVVARSNGFLTNPCAQVRTSRQRRLAVDGPGDLGRDQHGPCTNDDRRAHNPKVAGSNPAPLLVGDDPLGICVAAPIPRRANRHDGRKPGLATMRSSGKSRGSAAARARWCIRGRSSPPAARHGPGTARWDRIGWDQATRVPCRRRPGVPRC
jgi:hypothetical protein